MRLASPTTVQSAFFGADRFSVSVLMIGFVRSILVGKNRICLSFMVRFCFFPPATGSFAVVIFPLGYIVIQCQAIARVFRFFFKFLIWIEKYLVHKHTFRLNWNDIRIAFQYETSHNSCTSFGPNELLIFFICTYPRRNKPSASILRWCGFGWQSQHRLQMIRYQIARNMIANTRKNCLRWK